MVRKILILGSINIMFFTLSSISNAYDNEISHVDITERSVSESIGEYSLDSYLIQYLDFSDGFDTRVSEKRILEWLQSGSRDEDKPKCRASNHFLNPLLPWEQAKMTDDVGPLSYIIGQLYCGQNGWPYENRKSNVTWATGYLSPSPTGLRDSFSTDPEYAPINWDMAREYYYSALTSNLEVDKESNFAHAFEALGHVLHLLQDVSVPAHVRNDFTSHLTFTGIETINPASWFGNPFEYYVKTHPFEVSTSAAAPPTFTETRLTAFWDTDQYTGETPPSPETIRSLGLAESTNAIYLSDETIPTNWPSPLHDFPFPRIDQEDYQICEEGLGSTYRNRKYISRKDKGPCPAAVESRADHFAAVSVLNNRDDTVDDNIPSLYLVLDNKVHATYADEILPRAVGYSTALLNYFFRGSIEINQPSLGGYAWIEDPAQGFTQLSLLAKNISPDGEDMTDGSIELVIKYRISKGDPFQNVPVNSWPEFYYTVVPVSNNISSIPRDTSVELVFDLSAQEAIPVNATDVYLQLVYRGTLGNEEGAVAIGFKDISEPTPVDFFNNLDKICLNGTWYDAGSPTAISVVDGNTNGIADPEKEFNEWDVYTHDLKDIYIGFSSSTNPQQPTAADHDGLIHELLAGDNMRLFVLADYDFSIGASTDTVIPVDSSDFWLHLPIAMTKPFGAVKNQEENDIQYYPQYKFFRGLLMQDGIIFQNPPYPEGSVCENSL